MSMLILCWLCDQKLMRIKQKQHSKYHITTRFCENSKWYILKSTSICLYIYVYIYFILKHFHWSGTYANYGHTSLLNANEVCPSMLMGKWLLAMLMLVILMLILLYLNTGYVVTDADLFIKIMSTPSTKRKIQK